MANEILTKRLIDEDFRRIMEARDALINMAPKTPYVGMNSPADQ